MHFEYYLVYVIKWLGYFPMKSFDQLQLGYVS